MIFTTCSYVNSFNGLWGLFLKLSICDLKALRTATKGSSMTNSAPLGTTAEDVIDENDVDINSMQTLRKGFISQLAKDGKLPSDPEDRSALITLMKDVTSSAYTGKKIKADQKLAVSNQQMVANLAEAVRASRASSSAKRRTDRKDLLSVPERTVHLVPNQLDVGCFPVSTASVANAISEGAKEAL